jgi:hypothetical protein
MHCTIGGSRVFTQPRPTAEVQTREMSEEPVTNDELIEYVDVDEFTYLTLEIDPWRTESWHW